jgi:ABC-2 type transport system ATP-binding protein
MPIVLARDLAKAYGGLRAVDNLSLDVDEGQLFGLIGPNGAGKTTTIKMILGLTKPDSGLVRLFGEDPWDNPVIRSFLGVVFEKAHFPSHQGVRNYLIRACRIFGLPESRANEVLETIGLSTAQNKQIGTLSAGMLQKFAIGHAIIHSPRLVVADEMTSNLDPGVREIVLKLVLQIRNEQKTTFILSSHILQELSKVCDSVAVMDHGRILVSGRLDELYQKYSTGITRILTDKPQELAQELRKISYVKKIDSLSQELWIHVESSDTTELYQDALKTAKRVDAKILSISTDSASLEQLYNAVMKPAETA